MVSKLWQYILYSNDIAGQVLVRVHYLILRKLAQTSSPLICFSICASNFLSDSSADLVLFVDAKLLSHDFLNDSLHNKVYFRAGLYHLIFNINIGEVFLGFITIISDNLIWLNISCLFILILHHGLVDAITYNLSQLGSPDQILT